MMFPFDRILFGLLCYIFLYVVGWPLFSLALAWPLSLLWNWLMPAIFSLPQITFLQAAGLMLLVRILFQWSIFLKPNQKEQRESVM